MKIMRDVTSGASWNCKIRAQVGFTAYFIGKKRNDGKCGISIGFFAPSHGHSDTDSGYKLNKFFMRFPKKARRQNETQSIY